MGKAILAGCRQWVDRACGDDDFCWSCSVRATCYVHYVYDGDPKFGLKWHCHEICCLCVYCKTYMYGILCRMPPRLLGYGG